MTSENKVGVPDMVSNNQESENQNKPDENHPLPFIFCQMDALRPFHDVEFVWKEVRRWVKFEEELEEDGNRWSKPHVSSLCMQYLTELHMIVTANPIILDLQAKSMFEIVDLLLEHWTRDGTLQTLIGNHVRSLLLKKHKHKSLHKHMRKRHLPRIQSQSSINSGEDEDGPTQNEGQENKGFESENSLDNIGTTKNGKSNTTIESHQLSYHGSVNKKFKRKIPPGSEVMNIMIGEVEDLKNNLCAFIRLNNASDIGMITEVDLPTRFLFILLVPKGNLEPALEAGRCMGCLITDEIFREIAYKAESQLDILSGIQEFASQTTVLPPGCWNHSIRIEPPEELPTKESRKARKQGNITVEIPEEDSTLQRTGRFFGGLIADIKRKLPWYKSDFTDAIHIQCIASFIYLFLATLTPNVTFGGLLGKATNNYMGPTECILAAAVTGVVYALFSGSPLNIIGSTGPMLVLEMILYSFCKDHGWDYMPLRCWVGLWVALFILIIVALDLSALVRYITRFTEECFACLIAIIFIYQSFENLYELEKDFPVHFHVQKVGLDTCTCTFPNLTIVTHRYTGDNITTGGSVLSVSPRNNVVLIQDRNTTNEIMLPENCSTYGGISSGCDTHKYVPDVFFLSIILFCGTFGIAITLVNFKGGRFATTTIRRTISDFGILIAIIAMVCLDAILGIPTPKLSVPGEFKPSNDARGWFINPVSDKNPWWLIPAASLPGLLTTILVFMDQQITAVIVNRPAHKLRKGGGYHLDMLVIGVLIVICSLFGLPWYVAATVSALAHIMSLRRETDCTAPGEKPSFLGVREQRVTSLLVGILSGLSVFITSVLKYIPMAVLYGVFLYMGVAALNGMQLVQRIAIMFMPSKYQPDYKYLRHVPLLKVHLFTGIQIVCLILLWVVKSVKEISIIFPLMVLACCFVRKGCEFVFTKHELKWLDGAHEHKSKKDDSPTDNKPDQTVPSEELTKKRGMSLPEITNKKISLSEHRPDENVMLPRNVEAFNKRNRKASLMSLPCDKTYRKSSEHCTLSDFQTSLSSTHRALSQDHVDGVRNQEIFDKRKTRRQSLLALPANESNTNA